MVIRIRLSYGSALRKTAELNRQAALMMSSLMTPLALMAVGARHAGALRPT